jgi:hypothetical protein
LIRRRKGRTTSQYATAANTTRKPRSENCRAPSERFRYLSRRIIAVA